MNAADLMEGRGGKKADHPGELTADPESLREVREDKPAGEAGQGRDDLFGIEEGGDGTGRVSAR